MTGRSSLRLTILAAVVAAALLLVTSVSSAGGPAAPARGAQAQAPAPAPATGAPRPAIRQWPLPITARRRSDMRRYSQRHYGIRSARMRGPHVIVQHVTVTRTARQAWEIFRPNRPDPELGELPGLCAHFIVDRDGTIFQLAPLDFMCRHTVGLNYTAVGVEHVGMSDADVLGNRRQLRASLALSRWLRCAHGIRLRDVIGHNENTRSPWHRERVARLRTQTHGDMRPATMRRYRARLGACPAP